MSYAPSGRAGGSRPRLRYEKIAAAIIALGSLCLMFASHKHVGWLESLGWIVNSDDAGFGLIWLGGMLLFSRLIYSLCRGKLRGGRWIGGLLALAFLILASYLAPEDISIDHVAIRPSPPDPDTDHAPSSAIATYSFSSFRSWNPTVFRSYVASTEQDYPARSHTLHAWDGPHNALYGKTIEFQLRPLSDYDLASMQEDGRIDQNTRLTMQGKGFECVTRTDQYFGPFSVIHWIRDISDLSLAMLQKQCRLIDPQALTQGHR